MANPTDNVQVARTAVVEDSVTHQAGDGITANMSPAIETPDIFDNTAQPAVKTVTETVPVESIPAKGGVPTTGQQVTTEGVTTQADDIPRNAVNPSIDPNMNPNGVSDGDIVRPHGANINPNGVSDSNVVHHELPVQSQQIPNAVSSQQPAPKVVMVQDVLVEDSITHQAGEGMTANMSPSMETPDIFDNTAQPALKTVATIVDLDTPPQGGQVAANIASNSQADNKTIVLNDNDAVLTAQNLEGENHLAGQLHTLPDGSVDIARLNLPE